MKRAFTLAEALIALCIIGVIVALLLRTLNRVTPNKEKVMFVKAYHALEQVVADTINDPNKYDQEYEATENADFRHDPLSPDGSSAYVVDVQGTEISVTAANALCAFAAEKLNIIGDVNCGNSSRNNPNFVTSNGVIWYGLEGAISENAPKEITVDVNGDEDDGEYNIEVYYDGKVSIPTGGKEEEFLSSQTKIR